MGIVSFIIFTISQHASTKWLTSFFSAFCAGCKRIAHYALLGNVNHIHIKIERNTFNHTLFKAVYRNAFILFNVFNRIKQIHTHIFRI